MCAYLHSVCVPLVNTPMVMWMLFVKSMDPESGSTSHHHMVSMPTKMSVLDLTVTLHLFTPFYVGPTRF